MPLKIGDVDNMADAIRSNVLTARGRQLIREGELAALRFKFPQLANHSDAAILDGYTAWLAVYDGNNQFADEEQFLLFIETPDE